MTRAEDDFDGATVVGFKLQLPIIGGRFRVKERLGGGGMGDVYRATDLQTGREVALKVPHLGDASFDKRFELEINALSVVVSSATVGFVARGSAEDPFLAMELVAGESLADHLVSKGALPRANAHAVAIRIASALAAIHLSGWVHRDVKPGNIVLTQDGGVRLVDFGIARAVDGAGGGTVTGQLLGTLGYLAPEQLVLGRVVHTRTDVYALGCTLFECATGLRAWKREIPEIIAGEWAPAVHPVLDVRPVPAELREAVLTLTANDPELRPQDGLEALTVLLSCKRDAASRLAVPTQARPAVRAAVLAALEGPVVVHGARGAGSSRAARAAALLVSEILAPASVFVLRGNGRLSARSPVPYAHAVALASVLADAGFGGAARFLRGEEVTRREGAFEPSLVLAVEDLSLVDIGSRARLRALAHAGLARVVASDRAESEGFQGIHIQTQHSLSGEDTTCDAVPLLALASLFGSSFDASAVSLLAAQRGTPFAPIELDALVNTGALMHLRKTAYAFTSRGAWEDARMQAPAVDPDLIEHFSRLRDASRPDPVEVSTFWRSS